MAAFKCPVCNAKADNCSCPNICRTCLAAGNYQPQQEGECTCCRVCGKARSEDCGCCDLCRKGRNQCRCDDTSSKVTRVAKNPPDIKNLIEQGKSYLPSYVSSLRRWARTGGITASEQADEILMMVSDSAPKLYKEMDSHFCEDLVGDKEGTAKIIKWL